MTNEISVINTVLINFKLTTNCDTHVHKTPPLNLIALVAALVAKEHKLV